MIPYLDDSSDVTVPFIPSYAPTASTASNQLASGGGGLESLLNLAVSSYTSILGAKAAANNAKTTLANANRTGVNTTPTAAPDSVISPKVLLIGAGVLAAGILAIALTRSKS